MRPVTKRVLVILCCLIVSATADEPASHTRFTEHLIADGYGYAFAVAATDIDSDGDLDLTGGDTVNNAFYWFENDGKGAFRRHFIQKDEPGWFERHAVGDIDGDKRPDVVVVKNLDGHLVWFQNPTKSTDGSLWPRHVISTDLKRAYDVALADFDGDGDLDAAASAWVGNHFAWFENPGKTATASEWTKHLIDQNIAETRTIRVADLNGDSKPDLLGTARGSNLTAWYENTGKPADKPWPRHVIDDKSPQPVHGHPVDVDRDGDMDVVMALGMLSGDGQANTHQIAWYENVGQLGRGEIWKKHVIGPLLFAFEAFAGDLDGDRDLDVVVTAWGGAGQVVWFQNSGDPKVAWSMHMLKEKWSRANQAIIADLDGDKRPDIAATAERGANELRWWRNEGTVK